MKSNDCGRRIDMRNVADVIAHEEACGGALGPPVPHVRSRRRIGSDGRLLTERDLQEIRRQLEGFKSVTAISDEMRDVIEPNGPTWPPSCCRPKMRRSESRGPYARPPVITRNSLCSRRECNADSVAVRRLASLRWVPSSSASTRRHSVRNSSNCRLHSSGWSAGQRHTLSLMRRKHGTGLAGSSILQRRPWIRYFGFDAPVRPPRSAQS
jgi:hypothetical protein